MLLTCMLLGLFHGVDQPDEFFCDMGYDDIVILTLSPLLGQVGNKSRIQIARKLSCIKDGIARVSGTSFLHVGIAVGKLP